MGYCHEFYFTKDVGIFDKKVLEKINRVLSSFHKKKLIQFGFDNSNLPVAEDKAIRFNGVGEKGYESFYLTPGTTEYNFIKTGSSHPREYDLVVCIVLLILKAHYKDDFYLNSDGFYKPIESNWLQAIKYVNKVFKKSKFKLAIENETVKSIQILDCEEKRDEKEIKSNC